MGVFFAFLSEKLRAAFKKGLRTSSSSWFRITSLRVFVDSFLFLTGLLILGFPFFLREGCFCAGHCFGFPRLLIAASC